MNKKTTTPKGKAPDDAKASEKNPTTNYRIDPHKAFCRRCIAFHHNKCPITHRNPTNACKL